LGELANNSGRAQEVRCFHEQVMEGCHPAAGMADTIAVGKGFAQNLEKSVPIPIIQEDGLLGIAPDGQVIKRPGELGSQGNVMKVR
jgi:hypothetical protein